MADEKKHIDGLLRDALGNYTEVPPANAWADMEARLPGGADHLDDLFREAFAGMEAAPPAGAWEDMEARLAEKPRRRRGLIWFWLAASVAGVLIGGLWFQNKESRATAAREERQSKEAPVQTVGKTQVQTAEADKLPVQPTANEKQEEEMVQQTSATPEPSATPKAKSPVPVAPARPKPENIVSAPVQKKQTDHIAQVSDNQPSDGPTAQQDPLPTPQNNSRFSDSAKNDGPVDDIAAAMRKRGSGVVMNVTRSRYADSMAQIEEQLKQKAAAIASARPMGIAKRMVPQPVTVPDVATVAVPPATPQTADTMSDIAAGAISKTTTNLVGVNDAPIVKQVPDVAFVAPTDDMKQLAAQDPNSDKGSLAAFIGPMPDTTNYLADVKGMDPVAAEATIRERLFFDVFAKAGYERGFYKQTAHKFVLAPSFYIGLSSKFGVILQPSFKVGAVNFSTISGPSSYYSVTESLTDSINTFPNPNSVTTVNTVTRNFFYRQTHDSVVLSYDIQKRRVVEAELPVLASYNVGKGWSLYGGPVVSYGSVLKVSENQKTYAGATRRDTFSYTVEEPITAVQPRVPTSAEIFQYSVDNITSVNRGLYANSSVNKVRFGYMAGTSWLYKDKLSFDLSVQQNLSRMDYIPNAGIRNIYLQPYVRFMIGYKVSGKKK